MVCKAKIVSINGDYRVTVNIPTFYRGEESIGATPSSDTLEALICVPPSVYPKLRKNDTVWVDFEDDNVDKPVVMGILYSAGCFDTKSDIKCNTIEVKDQAVFSENTSIGEITSENIKQLSGISENIQSGLTDKHKRLTTIEKEGCISLVEMLQALVNGLSEIEKD